MTKGAIFIIDNHTNEIIGSKFVNDIVNIPKDITIRVGKPSEDARVFISYDVTRSVYWDRLIPIVLHSDQAVILSSLKIGFQ